MNQIVREIKFALDCGKEVTHVKTINDEAHFYCETAGYWVVTLQEADEVLSFLKPVESIELTEKETLVLNAMYECTPEIGLPVETIEIMVETGLSKRSIVGVLSSLYKKDLVESYGNDFDHEFCLSETAYDMLEKEASLS